MFIVSDCLTLSIKVVGKNFKSIKITLVVSSTNTLSKHNFTINSKSTKYQFIFYLLNFAFYLNSYTILLKIILN